MYHNPEDKSAVYDLVAWPTSEASDRTPKYVEVETSPEKKGHVKSDYRTLTNAPGEVVWVTTTMDTTKQLFKSLSGVVDVPPTRANNYDKWNAELDDPGITNVYSVGMIRDAVSE